MDKNTYFQCVMSFLSRNPSLILILAVPMFVGAQTSLLSLTAQARPKAVRIDWKTINEHQTDRFVLLVGSTSSPQDTCYVVKAAGESAEIKSYSFTHRAKADSQYYYRLHLIQQDGNTKPYPLLQATALAARNWEVYPNPTSGPLNIDPQQFDEVPVTYQFFDLTGRERLSGTFPPFNTRNVLDLRFYGLPNGLYYLRLFDGQDQRLFKIILM